MTNLFYIPSLEEMINLDHIIRAKYALGYLKPASVGDENLQPSRVRFVESSLDLVLTELHLDKFKDRDEDIEGVSATSHVLSLRRLEADLFWEALKTKCVFTLQQLPSKEERDSWK